MFYRGKLSFLGLKISMQVLRPSDQSSVGSNCASDHHFFQRLSIGEIGWKKGEEYREIESSGQL